MKTNAQREVSAKQFVLHQAKRRRELWGLLGDLPLKHKPKPPSLLKTDKYDGYTLEHLELDLNGIEPVRALLLIPDRRQKKAPGLLYIHAHGGTYELGKEEPRAATSSPRMLLSAPRRDWSRWRSTVGASPSASTRPPVPRESKTPSSSCSGEDRCFGE
jgi:hypothetical protein